MVIGIVPPPPPPGEEEDNLGAKKPHLTPAHNIRGACQHVHHFSLALVPPLGPQHHHHPVGGLVVPGSLPWGRPAVL